jgi:uncharacterized protein (UPF0210 family)
MWSRLGKKQIIRQEITAASSSLLASINEHNEKMGVATDNLVRSVNPRSMLIASSIQFQRTLKTLDNIAQLTYQG